MSRGSPIHPGIVVREWRTRPASPWLARRAFTGSIRHCRRAGHFRQVLAVRSSESQRAVGQSLDLIALFVNSAMVPATEQGEVREHRRSALSPVNDVMTLSEPHAAAREATTLVAMVQRSSDRRRDRACPGGDLYDTTVPPLLPHPPPGIPP